ncbi:hypothetical protein N657DRAFT_494553 [Parathielavia appendiculata]|uniref:C2H2-type domain-containing protein n=1 Tax=Parathielavia appendiculata TaxID=2587402 RepID=A0AAN6TYK5_9PEZI|nr:hypothetical protein N657DRAFT_494553 [Parathielavia appendiculata]
MRMDPAGCLFLTLKPQNNAGLDSLQAFVLHADQGLSASMERQSITSGFSGPAPRPGLIQHTNPLAPPCPAASPRSLATPPDQMVHLTCLRGPNTATAGRSDHSGTDKLATDDNASGPADEDVESDLDDKQGNDGDGGDIHEEDEEGDGSGADTNTGNKGAALNEPLSCPYRKRNRARFNIRNHISCTKPFRDLSKLKAHISKDHHRVMAFQRGDLAEDVEDGITEAIAAILVRRKGHLKVCTWEKLCKTLFPSDTHMPSSQHEPCIPAESHEFIKVATPAWSGVKNRVPEHVADALTRHGGDVSAISSHLQDAMDADYKDLFNRSLRHFERSALQEQTSRSTTLSPDRIRTKKEYRPKLQTETTATTGIADEHQTQPQRRPFLAPNPAGDYPLCSPSLGHFLPSRAYQTRQQHRDPRNTTDAFLSVTGTGYQAWSVQTAPGTNILALPSPVQYSVGLDDMAPVVQTWQHGNGAEHQFLTHMRHGQSPATGRYAAPHSSSSGGNSSQQ